MLGVDFTFEFVVECNVLVIIIQSCRAEVSTFSTGKSVAALVKF